MRTGRSPPWVAVDVSAEPGPADADDRPGGLRLVPDDRVDELYRDAKGRMMAYLRCHRIPSDDAADVVQDAFAQLLQRFDEIANHEGYVRTIVLNRCRRADPHRGVRGSAWRTDVRATGPDVAAYDDYQHLVQALHTLPQRQREVVLLTVAGFGTDEIAALLGIPKAATVWSHLRFARAKLRALGYDVTKEDK